MEKITCVICGGSVAVEKYGSGVCSCGQRYEWDESYQPILTPAQIEWLRKMPKKKSDG